MQTVTGISILALLISGTLHSPESAYAYGLGTTFPSEKRTYTDSTTHREITMLTTSKAKDNKIYQTHPNWTANGRVIVFMSDRSDTSQYYAISVRSGSIIQLTDDPAPSNACLSRIESAMYYVSERKIRRLEISSSLKLANSTSTRTSPREVAELPEHLTLSGSISLDSTEKYIYLGVQYGESSWGLMSLNLETGKFNKITDCNFRVGHCQAHPQKPGLIMYCWETGGDSPQRMWLTRVDGSTNEPFYKETFDEWVTHEVWWGPERSLFTIWPKNEQMLEKPHGVAYIDLEDRSLRILSRKKYWHVGGSSNGEWAVADTFAGEIYLINGRSSRAKLLTQGHRPAGATVHPHPSFSPDSRSVLFCSERNGNWDLCLLQLDREEFRSNRLTPQVH